MISNIVWNYLQSSIKKKDLKLFFKVLFSFVLIMLNSYYVKVINSIFQKKRTK